MNTNKKNIVEITTGGLNAASTLMFYLKNNRQDDQNYLISN